MNDYVLIGKIVNTHGIKGELKILSNLEKKELVFKKNMEIFIGPKKELEIINTYRYHKIFDMITLKNYNNINQVLKYKGLEVFVKRDSLNLGEDEYLINDLIDCFVKENNVIVGKIVEIVYNNTNILLHVVGINNFYIPYQGDYISKVNIKEKEIEVKNIEGLIL